MMNLRDEYLAKNDGNVVKAASVFAFYLARDDTETFKVGYSHDNAILAAIEMFPEVTADQIRSNNSWETNVSDRLEDLRKSLENETISYGELIELQGLGEDGLIPDGDVDLLEAAGVREFGPERIAASRNVATGKRAR